MHAPNHKSTADEVDCVLLEIHNKNTILPSRSNMIRNINRKRASTRKPIPKKNVPNFMVCINNLLIYIYII